MADYASKAAVNAAIDAVITANGNNAITGPILNAILKDLVLFLLPNNLVSGSYQYLRMPGFDGTNNQEGDIRKGLQDGQELIWKYEGGAWVVIGGN